MMSISIIDLEYNNNNYPLASGFGEYNIQISFFQKELSIAAKAHTHEL